MDVLENSKHLKEQTMRPMLNEVRRMWYNSSKNNPFVLSRIVETAELTVEEFCVWFIFQKYVDK